MMVKKIKPKQALRLLLWRWQGGCCIWCGRAIPFGLTTLEHMVPLSAGGTSNIFNLAVACGDCNNRRGTG